MYLRMKYYTESFVKQCCKGNRITQKQLFEELYPFMFRVCLRYINQQAEAEDCVMRGFMKSFQNLERFQYEGEHSLFIWIRKIMINESLMFLRKQHNFMLSLEENYSDVPIQSEALSKIDAEELNVLIMRLPIGYRTVFNLYVVEGYEHKEIAKMLGISDNTSRTQLAKAKNKLRISLEQREVANEKHGR